jgi:arylsulfatase A-like enzyme
MKHTFHLLLPVLLTLICAASPASESTATETPRASAAPPNIVVIVSDDCGYNEFSMQGAKGKKKIPTPRIDSIAKAGVRFTNGYVSGAVCSPTRAGLLAGRYQQHFGHEYNIPPVYSETNGLPLSETLLPTVLKDAGYRTIALGKWHLGYAPKYHPMSRGFTDHYGFLQGARSYWPLKSPNRLNQLLRDRDPVRPEKFDYMTDELGREAVKYIADSKDKPFFMYLCFNATHGPKHATEADLAKTGGDKIPAMTLALDRAVGMVIDELKKQGMIDNTLLIFVNDNGGPGGHDNAPLRGRKGQAWEGGVRVPFALQWPTMLSGGKTFAEPVIALDIFPTAMAAAGVDKSPGKPLDGVDLIPFLTGKEKGRPHQTLYWKMGSAWAVRDGDLKLVVGDKKAAGAPALFDLSRDISESTDLTAKRPEDVKRLQALYDKWAAEVKPTPWGGGKKNKGKKNKNQRKPGK